MLNDNTYLLRNAALCSVLCVVASCNSGSSNADNGKCTNVPVHHPKKAGETARYVVSSPLDDPEHISIRVDTINADGLSLHIQEDDREIDTVWRAGNCETGHVREWDLSDATYTILFDVLFTRESDDEDSAANRPVVASSRICEDTEETFLAGTYPVRSCFAEYPGDNEMVRYIESKESLYFEDEQMPTGMFGIFKLTYTYWDGITRSIELSEWNGWE